MQDLKVIGVENGALLVASDDGNRYRIPIDEVLQSRLRQSIPDPGVGRKLSPREIQSHIRSGMSAAEVSAVTGVPLEYIQKFEGPVLAEREFVVESTRAVPVITALDSDPFTHGMTFGTAITARLHSISAIGERWASWKDESTGWVVKLSFTSDHIDHDARWSFDPRKHALAPLNNEAVTLSQQGETPGALVPRLRAVDQDSRETDSSRFDSGAFDVGSFDINDVHGVDDRPAPAIGSDDTSAAPERHSAAAGKGLNQTADLLDELRRRRGERESATYTDEDTRADHPSSAGTTPAIGGSGIRLVDVPLGDYLEEQDSPRKTAPQPTVAAKSRKGRVAMPSWDDIVFGARADDDQP